MPAEKSSGSTVLENEMHPQVLSVPEPQEDLSAVKKPEKSIGSERSETQALS